MDRSVSGLTYLIIAATSSPLGIEVTHCCTLLYVCVIPSLSLSLTHTHTHTHTHTDKSSNYGRRGRLETPPTYSTPTRHPPHHPSPHGFHNNPVSRERRKGVRGRVDNHGKVCTVHVWPCVTSFICVCVCVFCSLPPCQLLSVPVLVEREGRRLR